MDLKDGRKRVVIEGVSPEIDGGVFPVKRTVGERVVVEADILTDGHDLLCCVLLFRKEEDPNWDAVAMEPMVNDRWRGSFEVDEMGRYRYTLKAWVDHFKTWREGLLKKIHAGQDITVDLEIGRELIRQAVPGARGAVAKALKKRLEAMEAAADEEEKIALSLDEEVVELMGFYPEKEYMTSYDKELTVVVEREKAREFDLEIALDLAFQCSPDHPYVKEHPEWFRWRPDGTLQYAENPPKKYEDIYPLNFETRGWQELFMELKSVVLFWIEQGVRIFRVDNPHTKPFAFWERLIGEVRKDYPEVIFLSEAFTRPKVMYRLAKLGFSQSYTYFAWRNTKWEITQYFEELTGTEAREFFRPNLWPNTPDILTEFLQMGGRPAFMGRLVLAATLGASYGIYGPAFELCVREPRESGSEEYLDSEKYEIRDWNLDDPLSLKDFIKRVNRIRKDNPALQSNESLRFHESDSDRILCFTKHTSDFSNVIFVVVNLDPHHTHGAWVHFPVEEMGLEPRQGFQVHDLLSDARFLWHGSRNYLEIDPRSGPAFIFRVRRRLRTERDFDYFM